MHEFGRVECGDLPFSSKREWLVTNGIGGYAMGTVAGVLTRRYHGLLVAALQPPVGRTLLVTKLDETATYGEDCACLYADRRAGGRVTPRGFLHLERFFLEGATPVWHYALGDALLEKRIWMQQGANTTYVWYRLARASAPLHLSLGVVGNHRDHHAGTHGARAFRTGAGAVQKVAHGLRVSLRAEGIPAYVLSDHARVTPEVKEVRGYFLAQEAYQGLDAVDHNVAVGRFEWTLQPGESVTFVATTLPDACLDGEAAHAERQRHEERLLAQARPYWPAGDPVVRQLALAADQFVVDRPLPPAAAKGIGGAHGRSVVAGYPWFGDWGRDTMISLPGLALATGRFEVAEMILRTFGHYVSRGMIPNRFPDEGQAPEYNTVDATLWYFEAIRAYYALVRDNALIVDLFPVLKEIVDWHVRGTRYQIHVDPADGLLYAGEPGVQLTWMDAKVDDWVVTPRSGKAVEVNALWYNALRVMVELAFIASEPYERYEALARQARAGFARFWNEELGYCHDVLDGPEGNDLSLRPNQLFAVSLPHSPLAPDQQKAVVDACARHLLTSHGLRSLDPRHPDYRGHHGGDRRTRDAAYHQGTVWGWLIGPFVSAHLRVYRDPALARSFLAPLIHELDAHCVGSLSEIFDGNPPHTPRGCIAQAWTVAEVLRVWKETALTLCQPWQADVDWGTE